MTASIHVPPYLQRWSKAMNAAEVQRALAYDAVMVRLGVPFNSSPSRSVLAAWRAELVDLIAHHDPGVGSRAMTKFCRFERQRWRRRREHGQHVDALADIPAIPGDLA
jgi:hypothetical protein